MRSLLGFTAFYTVSLLAYGLAVDSPLALLYTGINVALAALFAFLHRTVQWSLPALWLASIVGLGNMLGGVVLIGDNTLYLSDIIGPIGFDKVFHFAAAAGLSLAAWEATERVTGPGAPRGHAGLPLIVWLAVMGGGAVVEIAEFVGASIGDVNVGDYVNNALDLVANALGGLLGVWLVSRARQDASRPVARS